MNSVKENGKSLPEKVSRKLWPLNCDALSAAARRRTGLEDFGEPNVEPPLAALTGSLEQEADLHPLGRFLMHAHLKGLLETRLRLTNKWKGEIERLEASPIDRPIFITGMPRSGSTFLHELLSKDPAHRSPRVWEVMCPLSAREPQQSWHDLRVWKTEMNLWWFRRFAPEADAVYPVRARTPHECIAIHSYTMWSEEFASSCYVPGYEATLRATDLQAPYFWQRRFLQHLQLNNPGKRWLLKSPDHVYGLKALFAAFPNALIIQTHRNPLEVLKSLIQLSHVLHGLFGKPRDRELMAKREIELLATAMERFIRFRDEHPEFENRFVDVNYTDLVSEPLQVVSRIYEKFDIPLSEAAAAEMRELAMGRARYSGRHTAAGLSDMGVNVPAQVSLFSSYCRRFGITPIQEA